MMAKKAILVREFLVVAINLFLVGFLIFLDSITPTGVSEDILYVIVFGVWSFSRWIKGVFLWAIIASCASIIGAVISSEGLPIEWEIVDRTLSISALWIMAALLYALRMKQITSEKNAERAERSEAVKTKFLAAASHDLRQPYHAMHLFIEVLDRGRTTEINQDALNGLKAAVKSGEELLSALLDNYACETGVVTPKISIFSVSHLINGLFNEYR
ncbi:MAG: hypothetical protein HQL37_01165, partial [Alphaproteobacteria bacterium]|nr:hypothetical protein [Alphaproteobacteria bacterium]